jgi:hypothetical protein
MQKESTPLAVLKVTLDRPRELRLSFRALKRFATATGKDLFRDGSKALATLDDFRVLVWALAREEDQRVTQDQLSPHITTAVVMHVSRLMRDIAAGADSTTEPTQHPN